jgi:hypothetical protein
LSDGRDGGPTVDDTVVLDRARVTALTERTILLRAVSVAAALHRVRPHHHLIRPTVRVAAECTLTVGFVLPLLAAYLVWGKAAIVAEHRDVVDA